VIQRLRAAGAVVHARTTTPEFSIATFTHSRAWGVTRNPWNLEMTPGGSSGGAGAALAAGTTTLATASDIGGSTRGPACFTGTVGYKAPYGRIPGSGPMSLDYYRGDGPLARTVDDALLMTNLMAGRHPHDHVSLPATRIAAERSLRGMRIAWSPALDVFPVDREVAAATRAAVDRLAGAGAEVVEVEIGWSRDDLLTGAFAHFAQMMSAMLAHTAGSRADELTDYARAFLEQTTPLRAQFSMFDAARAEYAIQRALADAMAGFDALVCPTSGIPGLPADSSLADGVEIDGRTVESFEALLTIPFNINNRCPVLALPCGFATNGMPLGMQVVGHPYDDETVFSIGRAWESLAGNPYDERRPGASRQAV
jgi:aspartyl-tRNA(Asn)/glutamyl-tRNA(Gln) amidotransferase subunit A